MKLNKIKDILKSRQVTSIAGHKEIVHQKAMDTRERLANRYLTGYGIEIGALNKPLHVPKQKAKVKYVDRMTLKELRKQYPELDKEKLVNVDIVIDGETLKDIESNSQNFIIANHFLEHCENPIKAIESGMRVLKNKGILYLAVPDKRFIFDADRPITKLDHVLKDYFDGPLWSRRTHFWEYAYYVNKKLGKELEEQINHLMALNYSIHFHCWTQVELLDLILYLEKDLKFNFKMEEFVYERDLRKEYIIILRKV